MTGVSQDVFFLSLRMFQNELPWAPSERGIRWGQPATDRSGLQWLLYLLLRQRISAFCGHLAVCQFKSVLISHWLVGAIYNNASNACWVEFSGRFFKGNWLSWRPFMCTLNLAFNNRGLSAGDKWTTQILTSCFSLWPHVLIRVRRRWLQTKWHWGWRDGSGSECLMALLDNLSLNARHTCF